MITITNVDSFYINYNDSNINQDLRKYTVGFGAIDGNDLPLYFDKRPVNTGRGLYILDYTLTTVLGVAPTSAANLQSLIEELLLNGGSTPRSVKTVAIGYGVLITDSVVLCNGTFTVTVHPALNNIGVYHDIKNIGTGAIDVDPDGAETIDGELSAELLENDSITIISDNTNWKLI